MVSAVNFAVRIKAQIAQITPRIDQLQTKLSQLQSAASQQQSQQTAQQGQNGQQGQPQGADPAITQQIGQIEPVLESQKSLIAGYQSQLTQFQSLGKEAIKADNTIAYA